MITEQQESQRILQLINSDNRDSKQLDKYDQEALDFIRKHLTLFYMHYGLENGLGISETSNRVSQWDLNQWQSVIDELRDEDWLPESKKRITAVGSSAGLNVGNMMAAIAGVGLIRLNNRRIRLVQQRAKMEQARELKRMNNSFDKPITIKNASRVEKQSRTAEYAGSKGMTLERLLLENPIRIFNSPDLSNRLWTDGDKLLADIQSSLFNSFRTYTSIEDFQELFQTHLNTKGTFAKRIKQEKYFTERLLRTETARMKEYINEASYRENGIKFVNVMTEPGACTKCISISANGPYPIDDAPSIPGDTHVNCRCGKVPATDINDRLSSNSLSDEEASELTYDEEAALKQYISSESYKINDALRRGIDLTGSQAEMVKNLDAALDKMPNYHGDITRSLNFEGRNEELQQFIAEHAIGKKVDYMAYTSSSPDVYDSDDTIRIIVKNSNNSKDIRIYNPSENEVLYKRSTSFKVIARYMKDGKPTIELEEVNNG